MFVQSKQIEVQMDLIVWLMPALVRELGVCSNWISILYLSLKWYSLFCSLFYTQKYIYIFVCDCLLCKSKAWCCEQLPWGAQKQQNWAISGVDQWRLPVVLVRRHYLDQLQPVFSSRLLLLPPFGRRVLRFLLQHLVWRLLPSFLVVDGRLHMKQFFHVQYFHPT